MKNLKFRFQAFLGSGFYTGYFPVAPATVTSFFTLIPAYFLCRQLLLSALIIIIVFFLGVWLASDLEKVWGKDPKRVTIDEICGTLITFFYNPVSLFGLFLGFLFWRGFDVLKLPFINRMQEVKGGWGVMLDDVLAGICANIVLRILILIIPGLRG
ncbi:MAG: phosphatidylglycerophosphatase A family protein [candidate division WOR-3 bacterium]